MRMRTAIAAAALAATALLGSAGTAAAIGHDDNVASSQEHWGSQTGPYVAKEHSLGGSVGYGDVVLD